MFVAAFLSLGSFVFASTVTALAIAETQAVRARCVEPAGVREGLWVFVGVQTVRFGKLGCLKKLASGAARNVLDTEVPTP